MRDNYAIAYNEAISELLISLRKRTGHSYTDLAYFLDLRPSTYYSYENGTREIPIKVLKDVCKFYNIDFFDTFRKIDRIAEARS